MPLTEFQEEIIVKGEGTRVYKFKETIHGPVLDNSFAGAKKLTNTLPDVDDIKLAFSWSVYDFNCKPIEALIKLINSQSISDVREGFSLLTSVSLGILVASTDNDILFQSTGRVPIRQSLGDLPLAGWVKNNAWSGYIPYEEMPYVLNPSKGFIVVANNYPVDPSYKHFNSIGRYFSQGRAERITEVIQQQIEEGVKFTSKDSLVLQNDELSVFARDFLGTLLKKLKTLSDYTTELKLMKEWNFILSKDSKAAAIYAS